MKMTLFWDVVPCSLEEIYQHFRGVKGKILTRKYCQLKITVTQLGTIFQISRELQFKSFPTVTTFRLAITS
jgi:hypothetical protein